MIYNIRYAILFYNTLYMIYYMVNILDIQDIRYNTILYITYNIVSICIYMTLNFDYMFVSFSFLSGFIAEVGSLSSFSAGPSNRRQRRIILTTDVAESSVTIPDVDLVIDCCTHKRPRWNPTLGFSDMGWTVNGMHCEERCLAIRTGRVRSLCSAAFFVAIWEAYFSYDSIAVAAGEGTQVCKNSAKSWLIPPSLEV